MVSGVFLLQAFLKSWLESRPKVFRLECWLAHTESHLLQEGPAGIGQPPYGKLRSELGVQDVVFSKPSLHDLPGATAGAEQISFMLVGCEVCEAFLSTQSCFVMLAWLRPGLGVKY